jgi:hypothetical protein
MSTVTLQGLTEFLERFGWKHYRVENEPQEQEGLIRTGWRSSEDGRGYDMVIDPVVEKKCLIFRVPWVVTVPWDSMPTDRLMGLLALLTWVNYRIILGKFAYDASDGEVRFSIDMPIDESDFNYAQFDHVLNIIVSTVGKWAPRLQSLLAGEKKAEDLLVESARESGAADDFVDKLIDVLRRRGDWFPEGESPLTEV